MKHRSRIRNKFLRERINNDVSIIKNEELAKIFHNFFNRIMKSQAWSTMMNQIQPIQMPLLKTIAKYENSRSILKFSRIKTFRACQEHDIPVNLVKSNKALSFDLYKTILISHCSVPIFPRTQQQMDAMPTYKRKDKSDIENYSPLSVLIILFKINERYIYERCIYERCVYER